MVACEKLEPGLFYHIYNRGNNKEILFKEEKNYRFFLNRWKKYIEKVANTYSFSLLGNHFHFFIQIKSKKELNAYRKEKKKKHSINRIVSLAFSDFFNSYAKSINQTYGRTGSLFQERFRRKLIDSDEYFTEIINYIHGNAQKHGLIENFCNYQHSSYEELLSGKPTFLMREEVFKWFGGREKFIEQHESYRNAMKMNSKFFENSEDELFEETQNFLPLNGQKFNDLENASPDLTGLRPHRS